MEGHNILKLCERTYSFCAFGLKLVVASTEQRNNGNMFKVKDIEFLDNSISVTFDGSDN